MSAVSSASSVLTENHERLVCRKSEHAKQQHGETANANRRLRNASRGYASQKFPSKILTVYRRDFPTAFTVRHHSIVLFFFRSYSILASDVRVEELSASLPNRVRHRRTRKIACGSILEQFPVNRNDVDRLVLEYRGRRGRARRRFSSDKIDGTVN